MGPACLAFHDNKREVATASRDQVRQPIYGSSIGRWKRYERRSPNCCNLQKNSRVRERVDSHEPRAKTNPLSMNACGLFFTQYRRRCNFTR